MMKKAFYKILGVSLLSLPMTGCIDFLQKDPPSAPSESVFWQKKSDFDSALTACYSAMYAGVFSQLIPSFESLTDNAICEHDRYGATQSISKGALDPTTGGFVSDYYSGCYHTIARIHTVLEHLEAYQGDDISEEEKRVMVGQCKGLRGYMYSWLYMLYRQVPLVTESLDLSNMYQPKAERSAIYSQIIADFDEAISLLPEKTYREFPGRLTKSAVKVMKARILLNDAYSEDGTPTDMDKFKEVVSSLESIEGYSLAGWLRDNFLSQKQSFSPEIIFSVRYLKPNLTNSLDLYYGNWHVTMPTLDLIDEFECKDGMKWGESPLTIEVNKELFMIDNAAGQSERKKYLLNRDPRMDVSIIDGIGLYFPDEGYGFIPTVANSMTHWNAIKLVAPHKEIITGSTISDADIVLIRYAEVLLMIAEAENEANGPSQKVYNAVNNVRARAQMPALPNGLSKDEMRERIRHEWRVEFCLEGPYRYFQLKRWNLMEQKVNGFIDPSMPEFVKMYKPAFRFFPLPQGEIDKSNGVLEQDPHYI